MVELLATEDTDIKPEHIHQIKELIKKEITLGEGEKEEGKAAAAPPSNN